MNQQVARFKDGLFETKLDHNAVERALKERPVPENCTLSVDGAEALVAQADDALHQARGAVRSVLLGIARRLPQPVLRDLLEQGKSEPFIAEVLGTPEPAALADLLARRIPADPALIRLLAKYLKRIVVKTVRLGDFKPSKNTVEQSEIAIVVEEFRRFLEAAVDGETKDQTIMMEIR